MKSACKSFEICRPFSKGVHVNTSEQKKPLRDDYPTKQDYINQLIYPDLIRKRKIIKENTENPFILKKKNTTFPNLFSLKRDVKRSISAHKTSSSLPIEQRRIVNNINNSKFENIDYNTLFQEAYIKTFLEVNVAGGASATSAAPIGDAKSLQKDVKTGSPLQKRKSLVVLREPRMYKPYHSNYISPIGMKPINW